MFHRLNDKGDNTLTEIPGCPEKRMKWFHVCMCFVLIFTHMDWATDKIIHIYVDKQSSRNVSVLSDMTSKIWAYFAKDWHKIGILQWKINED